MVVGNGEIGNLMSEAFERAGHFVDRTSFESLWFGIIVFGNRKKAKTVSLNRPRQIRKTGSENVIGAIYCQAAARVPEIEFGAGEEDEIAAAAAVVGDDGDGA